MMTMKTGRKQIMVGKISLVASFAACSSAPCIRLSLSSALCSRSVSAIVTPCFWAWMRAVTSCWMSGRSVRPAKARRAWSEHTSPHVVHRALQLDSHGTFVCRRNPLESGIEAQPRLHHQRQLVDGVGGVVLDGSPTRFPLGSQPVVGYEEQRQRPEGAPQRVSQEDAEHHRGEEQDQLQAQQAGQVHALGMPGLHQGVIQTLQVGRGEQPTQALAQATSHTALTRGFGQVQTADQVGTSARRPGRESHADRGWCTMTTPWR